MAEEIAKLKIGFSLDSSQLEKGMGHVLSNLNLMQKEFKSSMVGVDKYNKSLDDLGKEAEGLKGILNQQKIALASIQSQYDKTNLSLQENEKNVRDLKKQYDEAVKSKSLDEKALKELENEYNKAVKAKQKDEKALKSLHGKYIDMTTQVKRTEMALARVDQEIKDQKMSWGKLNDSMGKVSQGMKDVGRKLSVLTKGFLNLTGVALKTTAAVGTALGTIGVKGAIDVANSQAKLFTMLDLTTEQAKELSKEAQSLWRDGFGENLDEVTTNIAKVKLYLRNLGKDEDISEVTKKAMVLNDILESDIQETIRGIDSLMGNFGLTSEQAMDLMHKGAKKGLNETNDLADVLDEFGQLWKSAGFTAEEMFATMDNGLSNNAYGLSQVNDLIKEMGISMVDGRTEEYITEFSKKTQNLFKEWQKGKKPQKEVMMSMIADLEKMKNNTEKATLASNLWGGMGEDNALKVLQGLNDVNKEYVNVKGSIEASTIAMQNTPTAKFTKAWRDFQTAFIPIGTKILEFATKHLPKLEKWIAKVSDKIKDIDWKKVKETIKEVADKVLPPLKKAFENVWNFISKLDGDTLALIGTIAGISVVIGPVITILGTFGQALSLLRLGPLGLIIGAFAGLYAGIKLIIDYWDEISTFFSNIGKKIADTADWMLEKIGMNNDALDEYLKDIESGIMHFYEKLKEIVPKVEETVRKIREAIDKHGFKGAAQRAAASITDAFKDLESGKLGRDIIGGIAKGMKEDKNLTLLDAAANSVKDRLTSYLKTRFQIKSPSRLMAKEIGAYLPSGIAKGMTDNLGVIHQASAKMVGATLSSFPQVPNVHIPQSARNGVYGNQSNYTSNFSPTITIQGSQNPFQVAQEQDRLLRRLRFQGGIS